MGKPVERQNFSLSFFILAVLIAVCTGWAFYEEFLGRRPWKDFQRKASEYERHKAEEDVRFFERKIDSGDIQIALDPAKPDEKVTVAQARQMLGELDKELAGARGDLSKLKKRIEELGIVASDADLKVKFLKSEDDGLFYLFQHAQHEEALAAAHATKLKGSGDAKAAQAAQKESERHQKHVADVAEQRRKKHQEIAEAEVAAAKAAEDLAAVQKEYDDKVGRRAKLAAAIESALDPVVTAKGKAETAAKKWPELTQYWLTSYDNSVDRCQNCHALVDKCGYSRPHEIIEALNATNADPVQVAERFCVNPDRIEAYQQTASEVCSLTLDDAASTKGEPGEGGQCFNREQRGRIAEFLLNHCGRQLPTVAALVDAERAHACVGAEAWKVLGGYVQDAKDRGACDLELAEAGEGCVEGARRDQLLDRLSRECKKTSKAVTSLSALAKANKKACAKPEQAPVFTALRPVLFDYQSWAQTHPYRTELLSSVHPPDRFGCTTCHEGQGAQTKGVGSSDFHHGYDDHYWEKPMLDLVTHKKFRPNTFGEPLPEGVPGVWVSKQQHFMQATCSKCHTEDVSLKFADTYTKGRLLVAEIGCHGCHPIDAFTDFPRVGPTLTDLKKKVTPDFLLTWIAFPKGFRPRTKMPNFWPEALDTHLKLREGSPEAQRRETEVRQIAAYLWQQSSAQDLPPAPGGNAERGKLLAQQVGCRGCHNFAPAETLCTPEQAAAGKSRGTPEAPGECEVPRHLTGSSDRDFAPNLSNIGHKADPRWVFAWLKNPQAMWAQARMPNLRLTDAEAADVTAYLMTLRHGQPPAAAGDLFANEKSPEFEAAAKGGHALVNKYGCAGCHLIKGHENDPKIGADLNEFGRKTVDLLDFGNAIPNPRHHSWYNWVDLKLRAPRIYKYERVDARMPQFDFTDDEVAAVTTYLKSRTSEKVPTAYLTTTNERRTAVMRGDQLMEYLNCRGCHVIDGEGGRIRDMYLEDDLAARAPPVLQHQGWRVQPDWFFAFLHDPSEKLRPWLDVRMPTFPLDDRRATTLVRAFSARSDVAYPYVTVQAPKMAGGHAAEAEALVKELRCFACHTAGEPAPGQDRSSLAPNLKLARHRLRPDWVEAWLKNPNSLQEGTKMPSFFVPDQPETVMYPTYFGGSQQKQIEALRDYVMALGEPGKEQAAAAKPERPARRR